MKRALVVSQFMEMRLKLVQVLNQLPQFHSVHSVHNIDEARLLLDPSQTFDIVFIARSFGEAEIASFIDSVKRTGQGRETAFVMLMKAGEPDSVLVANSMFGGVHGFLCEPFSFERVEDAARLASAVHAQASRTRLRAATGLLLDDVIEELDPSSAEEKAAMRSIWEKVNRNCEKYKLLTGESVSLSLIKDIKDMPVADRLPKYEGVSSRVKGLLERKFKQKIQFLRRRQSGTS
jgi:DNA-binding NtrC family response regulator